MNPPSGLLHRWLSIVGIGEDGLDGLSPAARTLIEQASLVVGGRRHLALLAGGLNRETLIWPSPPADAFPEIRARRGTAVCVVATGDPFCYGIGSLLAGEVPPGEMICLPAASSFSLAACRLGWAEQNCARISLHGRALELIIPLLRSRARVFALSWDGTTPSRVAALLTRRGVGGARITVCEAMGGPRERLRTATADAFDLDAIDPLNLIALDLADVPPGLGNPLTPGLPDALFEHDGQLTKQDIRALTLAALAPRPGEMLWDIGAGSGSVGIEWMLTASSNRACAIERDPVRAGRIARNAASLGVPDLAIVNGTAPAALSDLPEPDAVFLGGGATVPGMIDAAWGPLRHGGRMVANAVTLEAQSVLFEQFRIRGGELKTIQIARADALGRFHGMRPALPVTQWAAVKQ